MATAIDFKPLPFREAIAHFGRRATTRDTDRWTDMWQDEHAAEFTVARSIGYDVTGDIYAGLQRSLAEGGTFKQFEKQLTPLLQAKGWWDKVERPDGEV